MASSHLKKINKEAARIRERHPSMSYRTAQRKASADYKAGKLSGVKKRKSKKKGRIGTKPKYKVIHEVRRIGKVSYRGGSVSVSGAAETERAKEQLRMSLGQQAGWLDVAISSAKTNREKEALRKKKREIISELNRIK